MPKPNESIFDPRDASILDMLGGAFGGNPGAALSLLDMIHQGGRSAYTAGKYAYRERQRQQALAQRASLARAAAAKRHGATDDFGEPQYVGGPLEDLNPVHAIEGMLPDPNAWQYGGKYARLNELAKGSQYALPAAGGAAIGATRAAQRLAPTMRQLVGQVGELGPAAEALAADTRGQLIIPGRGPEPTPRISTAGSAEPLSGALAPELQPVRGQTGKELTAMQRKVLTPQEWEARDAAAKASPEMANAMKFMTPLELKKTLASGDNIEAVTRLLQSIPSAERMASVAKLGAPKRGWYRGSTQAIIDFAGKEDAPRFAATLAATSPQTDVETNLLNTLKIWKNWKAAGRPKDEASIRAIMGASVQGEKGAGSILPAWINNTVRALSAENPVQTVLSGPKVHNFFGALADNVYATVLDTHMADAQELMQKTYGGGGSGGLARGDPGYSPGYIASAARIRDAAQRAGMYPTEGQETIWSVVQPMKLMQQERGIPARDLLQSGHFTADTIRGTPDFSTLLKQDPYASVLREAGYGPQLEAMQPYQWPTDVPSLSLSDTRNIEKFAQSMENYRQNQLNEARSRYWPGFSDEATASIQAEGIPYIGSGHQTPIARQGAPQRASYSQGVLGPFENNLGQNPLLTALNMRALENRPTAGFWEPRVGPIETNIGRASPARVTLDPARRPMPEGIAGTPARAATDLPLMQSLHPSISPEDMQKLRTAATVQGAMTAQGGMGISATIPDPTGNAMIYKVGEKVSDPNMAAAAATRRPGDYIIDTGDRTVVQPSSGIPMSDPRAREMRQALGASAMEPGRPIGGYVDLENEWRQGPGSQAVTRRMMEEVDKLRPTAMRSLDTAVRQPAGDLRDFYDLVERTRQLYPRDDLMNLLATLRDQGFEGVRAGLRGGAFFPLLGALGLYSQLAPSNTPRSGG